MMVCLEITSAVQTIMPNSAEVIDFKTAFEEVSIFATSDNNSSKARTIGRIISLRLAPHYRLLIGRQFSFLLITY
jgi:hypothetical protein